MDRAQLNNSPREFTLGGRTFLVASLTESEKGQLQSWLKARHPGPLGSLDDATLNRFSPANRKLAIEAAVAQQRSWPPRVGSQPWWDAMDQIEGSTKFLHVVLSRLQSFAEDEAAELNRSLDLDEFLPLMAHAMGYELPDPKAPGATGTATTEPAGNPTPVP